MNVVFNSRDNESDVITKCEECPIFKAGESCLVDEYDDYDCCKESIAYFNSKHAPVNDNVNLPLHYTQGGIECWDAMEAAFGKEEVKIFCKLNAFKYVWRSSLKNGMEDIKKARRYLDKFIELSGEVNE